MENTRLAPEVMALGDLILNMASAGETAEGIALYERQPAGASANMLTQVARLGGRAALISKLGNDEHSRYLYDYELKCGVDMSNVTIGTRPTRIMFVYYDENNDRYFSDFHMERNEVDIDIDEVNYDMVKSSRYVDIKCVPFDPSLPISATLEKVISVAQEGGAGLVIDTQWRGSSMSEAERAQVRRRASICEVVKLTEEEMAYYFDESDPMKGTEKILENGKTQIVALTLDSRGCMLRTHNAWAYAPGFAVNPVDTTGAGDSFMGALLYSLCKAGKPTETIDAEQLATIAEFCNACAAYTTQFRGSLAHMATHANAEYIRKHVPMHEKWTYFA